MIYKYETVVALHLILIFFKSVQFTKAEEASRIPFENMKRFGLPLLQRLCQREVRRAKVGHRTLSLSATQGQGKLVELYS